MWQTKETIVLPYPIESLGMKPGLHKNVTSWRLYSSIVNTMPTSRYYAIYPQEGYSLVHGVGRCPYILPYHAGSVESKRTSIGLRLRQVQL